MIIVNDAAAPFEATLERAALSAGRLARAAGLGPGGRLVAALENSAEHLELIAAAWRLGLELVAVPPSVSAPTFAGILESTAPQAVAIDAGNERLARILAGWAHAQEAPGALRLGYARPPAAPAPAARPDSLAARWQDWLAHVPPALFYTSGSTSSAKGVPLLWPRILDKAQAVLGHYGVGPGDRAMIMLPLSHVYGLYWLLGAQALGADAIVYRESARPATLAAGLAGHGATVAVCPPLVGAFLFGRHGVEPAVRERLRVLTMGGAATSTEQAKRILAALPKTRVFLSYGLAETYSTICCNEASLPGADLASVGALRFGAFGEVRDPASGRTLGPGETGELCVGGTIMTGYVGAPAGEAFTADGLFRTGDLVQMDAAGAISITGRLKEMINAGGLSIYPAEIEEAIKRHPAVADCGVYGERSGELEYVCAAVVLKAPHGEDALEGILEHCRAHLAAKMLPRRLLALPQIPRGALGKIARAELRRLCAQAAENLSPKASTAGV